MVCRLAAPALAGAVEKHTRIIMVSVNAVICFIFSSILVSIKMQFKLFASLVNN